MRRLSVSRRAFVEGSASVAILSTFSASPRVAAAGHENEANTTPESNKETEWRKPRGLRKGDTIALIAPAGPADRAPVLSYKSQLEAAGFQVKLDDRMLDRKKDYLAGDDIDRAAELNQAIRDPSVRAIFPVRGGFGLTRILDAIDYTALRKDPKIITGYSDLTAFHLAIARKSRVISFHSPMPMSSLAQGDLPEHRFAKQAFERMLFTDRYPSSLIGETIKVPSEDPIQTIKPGKSQGRLIGGNLSLVCATLGTPYSMEPAGAILFLEDVNEAPYRVDRLFSQLRLAGVLDSVAGIIVGQFTTKDPSESKRIDQVIVSYVQSLACPVIANFPVGHVPKNVTIPHGAMAELNADLGSVTILEDPCT